jgi:hypothetical protein
MFRTRANSTLPKTLKLRKGQTVQEYTDGFRKMALMLDIPLHTQ